MPHGDFSDYGALFCAVTGGMSMYAPETLWFTGAGPLKPFFDGPAAPATLTVISFAGSLLMFFSFVLFVNRWNKINGHHHLFLTSPSLTPIRFSQHPSP